MKHLLIALLITCGFSSYCHGQANHLHADSIDKANARIISQDGKYIQKATIDKTDSTIWLTGNMRRDHRIFGYAKPDIKTKKMILLSIFTTDVKDNPFNCAYGAWYQTTDMDDMSLKFSGVTGIFIKVKIIKAGAVKGTVYMLRKWFEFEK